MYLPWEKHRHYTDNIVAKAHAALKAYKPDRIFTPMVAIVRYLSHPQVDIDPNIPVPNWGLSDVGRDRVLALAASNGFTGTTQIVSSAERKAIETATPLAEALNITLEIRAAMHENDRSATGYLPPDEFEQVADRFFAEPSNSVCGWEPAADAQRRIVDEVETVLAGDLAGDVLLVGHGGVGTLLLCHLARVPIARIHDQKGGGGNYFTFEKGRRRVLHPWRSLEKAGYTTV